MLSITRTNEEVSIVEEVGGEGEIEGREGEGVWRCVRIRGPMAFGSWTLSLSTKFGMNLIDGVML